MSENLLLERESAKSPSFSGTICCFGPFSLQMVKNGQALSIRDSQLWSIKGSEFLSVSESPCCRVLFSLQIIKNRWVLLIRDVPLGVQTWPLEGSNSI